ncbi:Hypothetical predicted protein [Cloeon dipterum]|uniref:Uncharacterized protein n=1 Tax=Cloeon dipterum TaxID=197152 RepID=A0A8S1DQU8_9INSE|nr:Hypothetical predicted protein [Cloeon dipterum]
MFAMCTEKAVRYGRRKSNYCSRGLKLNTTIPFKLSSRPSCVFPTAATLASIQATAVTFNNSAPWLG